MSKWTYQQIKEYIEGSEGNGCKLLMTKEEFEQAKKEQNESNTHVKLRIQCKCGNEFDKTNFKDFRRKKKYCNDCGKKILHEKISFSIDDVKQYMIDNNINLKLLSTEYINSKENLIFQCNHNHIINRSFSQLKRDKDYCYECEIDNRIKKLKEDFLEFYNKNNFIPKQNEFTKYGLESFTTYNYHFKNISNLCNELNIKIPDERKRDFSNFRECSEQEMLEIIKNYYIKTSKFPIERDFNSRNNLPSYVSYYNKFGSFKNAILLSGIEIPKERQRWFDRDNLSDKEMLGLLRYYTDKKLEKDILLLINDEINNILSMPHSSTYYTRFGGIVEAYNLIGINYEDFNNKAIEKDMIKKYKQLKEKLGYVPDSRDINKYSMLNECYGITTYLIHFGNLYNLQKMCGYVPTMIGRNKTKEEMIEDLQILYDILGSVPTVNNLKEFDFCASQNKYSSVFGDYTTALKEAGFDVDTKIRYTKNNTKCNSFYDYRMTTLLEGRDVHFTKEDYYKNYIKNFDRLYRFDFILYINNKNYFVEIFGITGNEKYDKKSLEKIQLCKDSNVPLITFYPDDFWSTTQEELYDMLLNKVLDIDEEYYDKKNIKVS